MSEKGPSPEFKKKILEEVKRLTDAGEEEEANNLLKVYFPDEHSDTETDSSS